MRTKDFIYYASAAVLMAVTTQVARADEVATQIPTVAEGSHYQAATAADIFGGDGVLVKDSPSSSATSTVATPPTATSEVANSSTPQVSQSVVVSTETSESRTVASESVAKVSSVASSENTSTSSVSEVSGAASTEPERLTHSVSGQTADALQPKANFSIENNNQTTGTFDAVVRDIVAPLGVKEVLVHLGV